MNDALIWILICGLSSLGLIWSFVRFNLKLKSRHQTTIEDLEALQLEQLDQMRLRTTYLNRYRFPDRNLSEALVAQPSISI